MARPALMPIATAVALTVASGLSIAAEHVRSSPAVALGALLKLPAPQGTSDAGGDRKAADDATGSQAKGTAAAPPPPAVGSRALTGSEEENSKILPARAPADRASE